MYTRSINLRIFRCRQTLCSLLLGLEELVDLGASVDRVRHVHALARDACSAARAARATFASVAGGLSCGTRLLGLEETENLVASVDRVRHVHALARDACSAARASRATPM